MKRDYGKRDDNVVMTAVNFKVVGISESSVMEEKSSCLLIILLKDRCSFKIGIDHIL